MVEKLYKVSLPIVSVLSVLITGSVALQEGNYFTPSLEISDGVKLEIIPNRYYTGDEISFNIPVYANSGSSDDPATFRATLYQDDSEIMTIEKIIQPEKPVLFSIPVRVIAQNPPLDEFKLKFVYEGTNDEPWYKGDVPYYYEGEISGFVEVKSYD